MYFLYPQNMLDGYFNFDLSSEEKNDHMKNERLLWLSRGNMGDYSDRGKYNDVIPRGEAPRDDIIIVPKVWIISHIPEAKSQ